MRFADRRVAPAYNVQVATLSDPMGGPLVIVGLRVTQQGNDKSQLRPMIEHLEQRHRRRVSEVLVDSGYLTRDDATWALERALRVVAPAPTSWTREHPALDAWKQWLTTAEARERYRSRKLIAERANAELKNRLGLHTMPVRGLRKVTALLTMASVVITLMGSGTRWLRGLSAQQEHRGDTSSQSHE